MLNKLNTYFVTYNVFISICSLALLFYFSLLTNLKISSIYYLFTFFGTLSIYNLYRLFPSFYQIKDHISSFALELIVYSLLLGSISFYLINSSNKYLYFIPVIISLAYKFPLFGKKNLRSLPYLKVFLISMVWVLMAIIPLFTEQIDTATKNKIIFLSLTQFFFFIAITIPFDVFDLEKDEIKTTATALGAKKAIYISLTCLLIYFVAHLILYASFKEKLAHSFISFIVFITLIQYKKLTSKPLQYYFVDGLIIIQTLIVYLLL